MAAVQYTFTHKQYTEQHNIFVNYNWVDTRWQQYSTHLHTNSTQNNTIYLLTTIGLTPGGSSTVHIYTHTHTHTHTCLPTSTLHSLRLFLSPYSQPPFTHICIYPILSGSSGTTCFF